MPVGFASKQGTRRIRFTTGVFHDGVDYGPDFDEQEADVNPAAALGYVQQGRAVYVDGPGSILADGTIVPDEEVVIGTGSSVRAVVGGGAINQAGPDDENLPKDFPGYTALNKATISTYAQLRAVEDVSAIPGIGPATAEQIHEALKLRPAATHRTGLDTKSAAAAVPPAQAKSK